MNCKSHRTPSRVSSKRRSGDGLGRGNGGERRAAEWIDLSGHDADIAKGGVLEYLSWIGFKNGLEILHLFPSISSVLESTHNASHFPSGGRDFVDDMDRGSIRQRLLQRR